MKKEEFLPKDLDEALDFLITSSEFKSLREFKLKTEDDAVADVHFFGGMSIRNSWGFWSNETDISKWFRARGITHADDMSGIIFTSLHRLVNNKPIDFEGQVKYYQDYWKKNGFPDGIPK